MYLVLCSSPSSGFYNPGQQASAPSNTQVNSNSGNSSATGTPKSSNSYQNSSNQASNSTPSQTSTGGNSGSSSQFNKTMPLKQTGAKSGLRRAAIGIK